MKKCSITFALAVAAASCSAISEPNNVELSKPIMVQVVEYKAGPNWDEGKSPEEQNLGGHFQMVADKFAKKELLANGPTLDDFHGFYIFNVGNEDTVRSLIKSDQGLLSGVLQEVKVETWQLMMENLGADIGSKQLFVLNYNPGSAWEKNKTLMEQDIAPHLQHVTEWYQNGNLLAGGAITDSQGKYIVAAAELSDVEDFVGSDPGVVDATFKVTIKPWAPFNRQGL